MYSALEKPFIGLLLCSCALACDKRTAEEKGQDYADEKLGFVEGASQELARRGKGIGTSVGKGLGDLVKGTGSAVKDVAHPKVTTTLHDTMKGSGLIVTQSNEGEDVPQGREVVIHLKATKEFVGKVMLNAMVQEKPTARANQPVSIKDSPCEGTIGTATNSAGVNPAPV